MRLSKPILEKEDVNIPYTDDEILEGIRKGGSAHHLMVRSFFSYAKEYAIHYNKVKYPDLDEADWEIIISNANLKLVSRIKNGWKKKTDVQLTTYYTAVVGFATLDYISERKNQPNGELSHLNNSATDVLDSEVEVKDTKAVIRIILKTILGNQDQLNVLLLFTEGYSYKEILERTSYQSEGACRNAMLAAKRKLTDYLILHPNQARRLHSLLSE